MLLQYSYVSLQVLAGSEKTTVSIALTIRSQNSGKVEIIEGRGPSSRPMNQTKFHTLYNTTQITLNNGASSDPYQTRKYLILDCYCKNQFTKKKKKKKKKEGRDSNR